jgi:prepilin-type N-terminal cleavage/methylation domain-containing protein
MTPDVGRPAARRGDSAVNRRAGVTLVELSVAVAISTIALTAAWPWLWNTIVAARATEGRAQAATAAAYAVRTVANDVLLAAELLPPPSGFSAERTLHLRHRHPGEVDEAVLIAWDSARRVLWRKSAGTYIADHVTAFSVAYLAADGEPVAPGQTQAEDWSAGARRVRIRITVAPDGQESSAEWDTLVGPW